MMHALRDHARPEITTTTTTTTTTTATTIMNTEIRRGVERPWGTRGRATARSPWCEWLRSTTRQSFSFLRERHSMRGAAVVAGFSILKGGYPL